jgi:hypothetical protein
MMQAQKESPLVRQAKKFFSGPDPTTVLVRDMYQPEFASEPQVMQSYTTYSLDDVPFLVATQK